MVLIRYIGVEGKELIFLESNIFIMWYMIMCGIGVFSEFKVIIF